MKVNIEAFGGYSERDGTVKFYSRVRSLVSNGACVVDWGCGRGADVIDLPSLYRSKLKDLRSDSVRVLGADVDEAARVNPIIDEFYLMTDGKCQEIESGSVDLVICDFVMEHVEEPIAFFSEIKRLLKPGGYFCARTTNKLGYVAIVAMLIPAGLHTWILSKVQPLRKSEDVFPAPYLINTPATIKEKIEPDFDYHFQYEFSDPAYFGDHRLGLILGGILHALLPRYLAPSLNVFLRKKL